ncbi:MAG: TOBE domain-containing protein [Campylobacteraceae bacterium]|jgi:molybdopterin-binding protein|nr:TOBE domain-containing protein [Campylobacteraceae bacterium]MBT3881730.1 TOBE domain-containing protein [Campylobacteraceae bacterium]MBT4030447.1 TOBE domain-containing protein [Campylobacteraceae bacterium]MBT4179342.1 TOBE domain-containing protein [Campylobacteraceae bacterium]MBT4708087.1 TOBE domain-containing protein [Campylobacteraceae bacterium]
MSKIIARVVGIESIDNLNIVSFDFLGQELSMMSLDLNENIRIGVDVELIVKASSVAIAKDFSGDISYSNQIKSTILDVDNGKLLSSIKLQKDDVILESIITVKSSRKMNLKKDDEVIAFIKANELSILKVL